MTQLINFYCIDKLGIYSHKMQVDPTGPLPSGHTEAPPNLIDNQVALLQNGNWVILEQYPTAPLSSRQFPVWEAIKKERDRRKFLGVKVGDNWFHSDDGSRIQQLGLVRMADRNELPPNIPWKTLTLTPPPVFVMMTAELANQIFNACVILDAMIFAAAETHRVTMEASDNPESYDFSTGWPATIYD